MKYVVVMFPASVVDEFETDDIVRVDDYLKIGDGYNKIIEISDLFGQPDTRIVRVGGAYAGSKS